MQKSKVNIFFWSVLAVLGISMTGCLKTTEQQPQEAKAYLSIMHLATRPTAVSLNVYFNDQKANDNAWPAGGVSQFYSGITKGNYRIDFKKAGGDSLVTSVPPNFYDSLHFYSIMLYNTGTTSNAVGSFLVEDDFSDLTLDKAFYRFWHASPAVNALGPVDVYIDNVKVQSNRQLADNQYSDYYNTFQLGTVGSHVVEVKKGDSSIFKTKSDIVFQQGNAYTLYLAGSPDGQGPDALNIGFLRAAN